MIRSISSVAGTRVFASLAQGILLYLLTQVLGPVNFGTFATVLATTTIIGIFCGLGTSSLALRISAYEDPLNMASGILALRIPTALLSSVVAYFLVSLFFGIQNPLIVGVSIVLAMAESTSEVVESVLFGLQRSRRAQLSMLTRRLIALVGVVLGITFGNTLLGLGCAAIFILVVGPIWLYGLTGRPANPVRIIKQSASFWGATVLAKIQTLDVVFASLVTSPVIVGVYASASRLTSPLNILTSASLSIITPNLAKKADPADQFVSFLRARTLLSFVGGSLILLSPLVAWCVVLLLGTEYRGVFWPTLILTVSTGISALTQSHVSFHFATGRAATVTKMRLIVVPLSLGLIFPLGTYMGAIGVATAVCASQIIQAIFFEMKLRKTRQEDI